MLEHLPHWLGAALRSVRAGADKLTITQPVLGNNYTTIEVTSPAFAQEGRIPPRFTADGEGVSPPLTWGAVPPGTRSVALVVEDADSPTPAPLVHAILWGLPADAGRIEEGAIRANAQPDGGDVGRNSYLSEGWLAPDPPTGHGDHRYAFQIFALDCAAEDIGEAPGRGAVLNAMAGHVIGAGLLVGLYSRGEPADVVPGDAAPVVA